MGFFSDMEQEIPVQSKEKKGFFSDISEEPSRTRSVLSAFPKGVLKSASSIAKMQDPLSMIIPSKGKDIEERLTERVFPTQKGHLLEDVLENAGEIAPYFAVGPGGIGSKIAQVGAGALSKKILKEFGAPELVQDIGSGIGSSIPRALRGMLSKKINPSSSYKEVYEMLKGNGFSDKEIVPFIQSKGKVRALAKWSKGFLNKDKIKAEGKPISESVYEKIKTEGENLPALSGLRKKAFFQQLEKKLDDIPYFFRDEIQKDVARLKSSPMNWRNLRDFEMALGNKIKGKEGGKAVLGILQEPIHLGEKLLSPSLYKEKQLMDKAYASHKNLLKNLKEGDIENIVSKGEIWASALSLVSGNPILKGIAVKKGSEYLISRFLSSPRFQGMQRKLLQSLKSGNEPAVLNLMGSIYESLDKYIQEEKE